MWRLIIFLAFLALACFVSAFIAGKRQHPDDEH